MIINRNRVESHTTNQEMERLTMSLWEFGNIFSIMAFCLCCLSMLALFRWQNSQKKADSGRVAPGPTAWPILGHLHLMNNDQPFHRTLWSLAQRYGPIMHLQLGCRPVLVVSSSHLASECLTQNDKIFASRPAFAAGELLGYNHTMLGLDPYGPRWRKLRKICATELLSPARIEMAKHIRTEEVSKTVRSLFERCTLNKGHHAKVKLKSEVGELSFNVIMRMVTDERYFGHPGEGQQFRDIMNEFVFLLGVFNVGDYIPFLRWLDLQGWERAMKRVQRQRDALVQRLVDEHRRGQRNTSDFIDTLISSLDHDDGGDSLVKATALSIITAAVETSANTMEWAMSEMLKHPEICEKAQEELDEKVGRDRMVEESDLPGLKYLGAIIKETLRLYPGAPLLLPHMSTEACRVGGYYVPAGTRLLVNAWAIHRDPADWERPLEFEPDRFLNKPVDVRSKDSKYITFGSGRRACPGESLGMRVVGMSVGRLLQGFDWSVEGLVDMREGVGMGLARAVPLEATIIPRLPHHLYQMI